MKPKSKSEIQNRNPKQKPKVNPKSETEIETEIGIGSEIETEIPTGDKLMELAKVNSLICKIIDTAEGMGCSKLELRQACESVTHAVNADILKEAVRISRERAGKGKK